MPSKSECGSLSISFRFMYAPGSPSSALQMMNFFSATALRRKSHFWPVENPAPAAPAQLGRFDLLDHHIRPVIDEHVEQRLITADRHVLFHVIGIDQPAIAQHDLLLALEERNIAPGGDVGVTVPVLDLRRDVVPILNLAERQVGGNITHHDVIEDLVDVLALHPVENYQRPAGQPDVHQRLLRAETKAADAGQMDIQSRACR